MTVSIYTHAFMIYHCFKQPLSLFLSVNFLSTNSIESQQNRDEREAMVVKMMKWRPWPPLQSKKFEAKITIHELTGILPTPNSLPDSSRFSVEIKWRGSKLISLTSLRKSVRRNFTKEALLGEDGIVRWDEEFRCFGTFSGNKDGGFHPWEVSFTVFNGLKQGTTTSLNLADFASPVEKQGQQVIIPLLIPGVGVAVESNSSLHLSVILLESRNVDELPDPSPPRSVLFFPRSPCYGEMFSTEKEAVSTVKMSPRRVNIFKALSPLRSKRAGQEEEGSDIEYNYRVDSDSEDDSEEVSEEESRAEKSSGYGTLAYANHVGSSSHTNTSSSEDEGLVYYSHHTKAEQGPDHTMKQNTKRRLLPWRKRKLSFRSPKVKVKGEPLLKKYYGEEGGDDIDFDRRQLSSSDESTLRIANEASVSAFGDDNFAVGIWEDKEITSRDGHLKLKTQVFFASIDQRSERAAGESACTALVAVIADWLQSNNDEMPIKSQLDTLIREGSLEWRNLCENESYKERFPDKHFDLETVVEAGVRPLSVVPEKSFIGFFHPDGLEDEGFDFLKGAMSFDNIWDEISSGVYIISWNDHFFILKVEEDAYYMIDTLGERLYEGCNQAFILKFDKDTVINRVADVAQKSDDKPGDEKNESLTGKQEVEDEHGVVCSGKESCKEYIKSFLAAIPIRELQGDLKKGLIASTLLHHRLQIEFHYTKEVEDDEKEESLLVEALE